MKLLFSRRDKLIIGLLAAVLILFTAAAQFYFLRPLKQDLKGKQQTLRSEQKLLETISKKTSQNNSAKRIHVIELEKELPVKPLEDQFILDLKQAETLSNSEIKSMIFSTGGQGANSQGSSRIANQQINSSTAQQPASTTVNNETSGTNVNSASNKQQRAPALASVSKLTIELNVESPNYPDFEIFINTLENLKRIVTVEAINYTGPSEDTGLNQEKQQPFIFNLTVSAFYMPGLTDLEKDVPKITVPKPGNKTSPLSNDADPMLP